MSKKNNAFIKRFLNDTVWCMAGLMLMNIIMQFCVYPIWSSRMGTEAYGDVIYLMSLLATVSYSLGAANNLSRMKASSGTVTANAPYLLILAAGSLLSIPLGLSFVRFSDVSASPAETFFFVLLIIATTLRYYVEVQYRLTVNYKGYFLYYLVISLGYLAGVGLYLITNLWPLALLVGECAGVALVFFRGNVFKWDGMPGRDDFREVLKPVATLLMSLLISELIINGDRILLKTVMGGTAVTIYYLASLLGKTASLVVKPLNSVIMGYLARYKGNLTFKLMHIISAAALLFCALATLGCTLASHVVIWLMYRQNYAMVKGYFIAANLAQILGIASSVISVVLLRFAKTRFHFYLNVIYAAAFAVLCIPAAALLGFDAFCIARLLTACVRFGAALLLGYIQALRLRKTVRE